MAPFLVCIHDATPAYARETHVILRDLTPLLGRHLSVGVVPNWHGAWPLTAVAWLISFIVLLLSATGIHSLMSFTVSRRTREIGIRAALGASPGRIVAGIFSRAFLQIGAGVLAGSGLGALLGLGSMREVLLLLAADGVMLIVGLAACVVPLRRALRIDPTEALRAEG